jgi:hypothetical protein
VPLQGPLRRFAPRPSHARVRRPERPSGRLASTVQLSPEPGRNSGFAALWSRGGKELPYCRAGFPISCARTARRGRGGCVRATSPLARTTDHRLPMARASGSSHRRYLAVTMQRQRQQERWQSPRFFPSTPSASYASIPLAQAALLGNRRTSSRLARWVANRWMVAANIIIAQITQANAASPKDPASH